MTADPINAGLWALAGYDSALTHCAELRERNKHLHEDHLAWISLNRFISTYLEHQCRELLRVQDIPPADATMMLDEALGPASLATTTYHVVGITQDPLMLEVVTYAMYLGSFTAHGSAPWHKFAQVMADCFYAKHPLAKKAKA